MIRNSITAITLTIVSILLLNNCSCDRSADNSLQFLKNSELPSFPDLVGSYPSYHYLGMYIDSLPCQLIPQCLREYYFTRKNRVSMTNFVDATNHTNIVVGKSRMANKGFLSVNSRITRMVRDSSIVDSCFVVSYVVNNNEVSSRRDIKNLIRLKESDVMYLDFTLNRSKKEITAAITTDKANRKRTRSDVNN